MGSKTFVGQFPEFNSQTDSFKSYVECVKFFFEANSIGEGKQLPVYLEEVFRPLDQHNLRIKRAKCEFIKLSVEYLGHSIDSEGLHTLPSKVEAIHAAS